MRRGGMTTLFFTICSSNYLAYALTLRRSVIDAYGKETDFRIILADELNSDITRLLGEVKVHQACDLGIEAFYDMAFRYTIVELNTAIKADCFIWFFSKTNASRIVYFDPDILVFRRLEQVDALLDKGADVVVTPHITHPLEDELFPDDQRHLQTGIYNLGFCAFRRTDASISFIEWWARKLKRGCRVDLANGVFVDQKYLDLLTCFVEHAAVLRHPGYNVAYWNLPHRIVTFGRDTWWVNGLPLYFFHFSGIEPGKPDLFSKHQNRYASTEEIGDAKMLVSRYIDLLFRNSHASFRNARYKYSYMSSGVTITDEMRRIYSEEKSIDNLTYDRVFETSHQLFAAPSKRVPRFPAIPFTTLMYETWRGRRDLQATFPLNSAKDQLRYLEWFVKTGAKEHNVDTVFLEPLKKALSKALVRSLDKTQKRSRQEHYKERAYRGLLRVPGLQAAYRLLPLRFRSWVSWHLLGVQRTTTTAAYLQGPGTVTPRLAIQHVDPTNAPGATVIGFLRAESGVGEAGRRTFRALRTAGYNVFALAVRAREFEESEDIRGFELCSEPSARHLIIQLNADNTLKLDTYVDAYVRKSRYKIGIWAWELSRFPPSWKPAFDQVDEVWAPSRFVQHSLLQATDKPVLVMPHPIPFVPDSASMLRRDFGIKENAVVILITMDFNSYVERKNPLAAIEAVRKIGVRRRDIQLVVKVHGRGAFSESRGALSLALKDFNQPILIDRVLTRLEMDALQNCCDVYISLHRSEGFGLNIAECMAKGKLVIATNYSGNRDFLDATCGAPVRFSLRPVANESYPHSSGQWWAEPDVEHAAELLRRAVEDGDWRRALGRVAQARIANDFSYESVGTRMRLRLEQIDAGVAANSMNVKNVTRPPKHKMESNTETTRGFSDQNSL
jgi:glycosyltransferase involved in cell wall biosynthesis